MELLIQKMPIETLTDEELKIYRGLSNRPFGEKLARAIARKLKERKTKINGLYYWVDGYGGLGLFPSKYGRVTFQPVVNGIGTFPVIARFSANGDDFVTWLASESDRSMSLYGEAFSKLIISKARLLIYLSGQYSPVWINNVFPKDARGGAIPEAWLAGGDES